MTYTPDFYLIHEDKWIEIKGYMKEGARIKIELFKSYYDENLEVLFREDLKKLGIKL